MADEGLEGIGFGHAGRERETIEGEESAEAQALAADGGAIAGKVGTGETPEDHRRHEHNGGR
jgi:hypothetical protein